MKKIPSILSIILVFFCFSCEKLELARVIKVTTGSITDITATSSTVHGNIIEKGEESITQHGHCWSTASNPSTNDSITRLGSLSSTGSFTSNLTGLTSNTKYYVRAYAIDVEGTSYGNEVNFTTLQAAIPSLTTSSLSNITTNSATCEGNVTDDGGATVTARGVCWGTSTNPTIANDTTINGAGAGNFQSNLTGLSLNTTYYVRAYATNSAGTAYGEQYVIKTATGTVTDFDGNNYYTVTIGTQVWMKEMLRTTRYNDGNTIPLITLNTLWSGLSTPAYSWYNNDAPAFKSTYGGLYNWYSVNTGKLCPTGWHVPTDAEWTSLTDFLGGESVAGGKMKEAGTAHWNSPNTGATNESGLGVLPGGYRDTDGSFTYTGDYAYLWSSTGSSSSHGWLRELGHDYSTVVRYDNNKSFGFSILCIQGVQLLPVVTTEAASDITGTTAILNGTVNANGLSTTVTFEYGTTISYGSTITASQSPVTGITNVTVSATLTGLTANITYHFRVKAESMAGTSWGDDQTFKISTGSCTGFEVTHTAGDVAPVSKTVTYGTVETDLTGENKCWITQNLGADNQADSATDASQDAGWYWQFNRKQGYKHDGSTRTPNTTWITSIDEASDWTTANDPCTILLGTGWRIPTLTEWTNANNNGGWGNYNDTYASVLKLHAAGFLTDTDGSLSNRGLGGFYWSSVQSDNTSSFRLHFNNSITEMNNGKKEKGFSVRCLRD